MSKNKETSLIEIRHYKSGDIYHGMTTSNEIVVLRKGSVRFSLGEAVNKAGTSGSMILTTSRQRYIIEVQEDTTLIIFRLNINLNFCDHFSFTALHKQEKEKGKEKGTAKRKREVYLLKTKDVIEKYLDHLLRYLNDGFCNDYLLEIKLKELLYALKYYYPVEELESFFAPILSGDFEFAELVRKHYTWGLSVHDWARKMNYSISGFEKRFYAVFDMSPGKWIQSQRAQSIYLEIRFGNKTFADLGRDFGFSSPSHFNNFCKQVFGDTPGRLRKKIDTED
jgi:AraC-like DNA-binding protein